MAASLYSICFIYSLVVSFAQSLSESKKKITIFAITDLQDGPGISVTAAQWLAVQEINQQPNVLSNYSLDLKVFDVDGDSQTAIDIALKIVNKYHSTEDHIYFPIVLGTPWSSHSTATDSVLGVFNMGQISSASTSIALSNTKRYPYFYRTIPSDELQAEGLITLCDEFDWRSIAVVYVNDNYGLHLSLKLQQLSVKHNIDITSIAVSYESDITYHEAAEQIKNLGVYIIILIIHSTAGLFEVFESEEIVQYPYFYLGADAWFDSQTISQWKVTKQTKGFIGTVPWQQEKLNLTQYDDYIKRFVNESLDKWENIRDLWQRYHDDGSLWQFYRDAEYTEFPTMEQPGIWAIYAYDAIYTLVDSIDAIEGDLHELVKHNTDNGSLINLLNNYIINNSNFIGASGHVTFNENGDRVDGLYSFGNILDNGIIHYFGYCYHDKNGTFHFELNKSKVYFPEYFTEKHMIPQSQILIHDKIVTISAAAFYTIVVLISISFVIAVIFMIALIFHRKKQTIKRVSWRFNIVMCIGAMLGCIAAVAYGFDRLDEFESIINLDNMCNFRLWMLTISYTLLFMPLFLKTYRLSRIFKKVLTRKIVKDKHLFIGLSICIFIDVLLLTIITVRTPSYREYYNGNIETVDALQKIQYIYGRCASDKIIYSILAVVKCCELFFGIYMALDVARIRDVTNFLPTLDETGIQLLSILFTVIIICTATPIYIKTLKNPDFCYIMIAISILLVINVVLFLNLSPRILAVMMGNDEKYIMTPIERMEHEIKSKLKYSPPPERQRSDSARKIKASMDPNDEHDTNIMDEAVLELVSPDRTISTQL